MHKYLDVGRAARELRWRARTSRQEALSATITWYAMGAPMLDPEREILERLRVPVLAA